MKTSEKTLWSIEDLASLLGIQTWNDIEDKNPDAWTDIYSHVHHQSLRESDEAGIETVEAERIAEEKALEAESEARSEDYRKWENALRRVAETYANHHGMTLIQVRKKWERFEFRPVKSWDDAANAIRTTINGVGYFGFDSLKEFRDSIPVRSSKQVTLGHLHWMKDYGDVYGELSPKRLMEIYTR